MFCIHVFLQVDAGHDKMRSEHSKIYQKCWCKFCIKISYLLIISVNIQSGDACVFQIV